MNNQVITAKFYNNDVIKEDYDRQQKKLFKVEDSSKITIDSAEMTEHVSRLRHLVFDNEKTFEMLKDPARWFNLICRIPYASSFCSGAYNCIAYGEETTGITATTPTTQLFGDKLLLHLLEQIEPIYRREQEHGTWHTRPDMFDFTSIYNPTVVQKKVIDGVDKKVLMFGDIHGSLHTFMHIINDMRANDIFKRGTFELQDNYYMVFLGDIVDYSYFSLEVLAIVFSIKIANEGRVVIINGNHEDKATYGRYELKTEMKYQLSKPVRKRLEKFLLKLPSALYIDFNHKRYHMSHGAFDYEYSNSGRLKEFLDHGAEYDIVDLNNNGSQYKWGDFNQLATETRVTSDGTVKIKQCNKLVPVATRIGRDVFCPQLVDEYLEDNNIVALISGHQDQQPLSLIVSEPKSKTIVIDKTEFIQGLFIGTYDMYVPSQQQRIGRITMTNLEHHKIIKLKPGEDFISLITSTASQSKHLQNGVYLELSIEPSMVGGRKDYYHKYLKYKAKYEYLKQKN